MMNVYRFGGLIVQVESVHSAVHQLCKEYRFSGIPCFAVKTTQADIEREREMARRTDEKEGRAAISHADTRLETMAVYRKIAEKLPEYGGFVFHGSAIAVDGQGCVFTAKSGTGKSTHTRLWRELLGDRAVMVNDDKPLIRVADGGPVIYGTPWDGKHRLSSNIAVPLKAVCILERAPENHIREISSAEALPMLLQQVYRPMNAAAMAKTLQLIDRLTGCVKLYRLGCNMNIEAARIAFEAMKGAIQ